MYRKQNVLPGNIDLQVAISRVALFNHDEALIEARRSLDGEFLSLIEFLLSKDSNPVPPFTHAAWWMMAGVTKSGGKTFPEFGKMQYANVSKWIFTGEVPWTASIVEVKHGGLGYIKPFVTKEKLLQLQLPPRHFEDQPLPNRVNERRLLSTLSNLFKKQEEKKPVEKYERIDVIYEFLSLPRQVSQEQNDIQRFIDLFPNNPNPILTFLLNSVMRTSTASTDGEKRIIANAIEALINLKFPFNEITHLFLAASLVSSDKTIRSFAAEMWKNSVADGAVKSDEIGRDIGLLLSGDYAPLKRFNDVLSSNMMQLSPLHNRELESLLTSLLTNLSGELPTGLKNLLEIFSEVLAINNSSVKDQPLRVRLQGWESSSSIKKIISKLLCNQ
jgi:hypothetical protein